MPNLLNLTDELTLFVLTIGSSTFPECTTRVQAQEGCKTKIDVIDRVAPMSAALQEMLDRCKTPMFVQIDEDMMLYPHAVRTLYRHLVDSTPDVAQVTYQLWDTHAARVIYGVKIYRHEIVQRYPYRNVQGCEFDQFRRYNADGFTDIRIPIEDEFQAGKAVLGEHSCDSTVFSLFERYRNLESKFRRHSVQKPTTGAPWVEDQASIFLRRFLDTRSLPDLYALMGVIAGRLAPLENLDVEKDFREYKNMPGLDSLHAFLRQAAANSIDPD